MTNREYPIRYCKDCQDKCILFISIPMKWRFRIYRFQYNNLWWILWIIASGIIYWIQFTDCRIGSHERADDINITLLNVSYSIFAAALFNCVLVYIPYKHKRKYVNSIIKSDFFKLHDYARLCRLSIEPYFSFERNKTWKNKQEYVKQFCETDLYETWVGTPTSLITRLERIKNLSNEMRSIIDNLLSFGEYLSEEQFVTLTQILNTSLFRLSIIPTDWSIAERDRIFREDNQEEIGMAIYDTYELVRKCKY